MENNKLRSWKMTGLNSPFELTENELPEINDQEVIVKIAGCGVCHTDLSFWHYGVKTKHELPLTLGHEISGKIVAGPEKLINKKVIIPAVLPCGECELCKNGRGNICQNQKMPGNDFDGGFASHIKVPFKYLCYVPESVLDKYRLAELSVVADAITTPYQVLKKSELQKGDFVICIGVGGVGIYGALLAKIMGATVLAIDINDVKLNNAKEHGIDAALNVKGLEPREVKRKVREIAKELSVSRYGWKILEMSGTAQGQELGYSLITFASTMSIVGFTMDKPNVRLSNLMAFDAKLIGTWGCKPELYKDVLDFIDQGKLKIGNFIETFPMSDINNVFKNTLENKYDRRSIMVPDFK